MEEFGDVQNCDVYVYENLNKYNLLKVIGGGSYGIVYKATEKDDETKIIAVKQLIMHNETEGYPDTVFREIAILKKLQHPNIIRLSDLCKRTTDKLSYIYVVFDYCKYDLAVLLKNSDLVLGIPEIKYIMSQLLQALHYVHSNNILHRDLKPGNILVTKTGEIKLADFGLARYTPEVKEPLSLDVVSVWYRPPEILLGHPTYSYTVDMWSLGCVMAELYTRKPIFNGETMQTQLYLISSMLGSITTRVWPGLVKCSLYHVIILPPNLRYQIRHCLPMIAKDIVAMKLLQKFLRINPSKRTSAGVALSHDFFLLGPAAVSLRDKLVALKE